MEGAWNTFCSGVISWGCRSLPGSRQVMKAGHVAAKEMSRTQRSYSDDEVRWQGCEREQGGIDVVTGQAIMPRRHEKVKGVLSSDKRTTLIRAKAWTGLVHASINIYSQPGVIKSRPPAASLSNTCPGMCRPELHIPCRCLQCKGEAAFENKPRGG